MSLDFLSGMGIEEGFVSPAQKQQFTEQLRYLSSIRTIAEIGFNAGHSAAHFFQECKHLALFAAFDLCRYSYTMRAADYFYKAYEGRFVLIPGDSAITVPEMNQKFPNVKFDLIYIDGCHHFEWAFGDICNVRKISHSNTILWIDDVEPDLSNPVAIAVRCAEEIGIIQVQKVFHSNDQKMGVRNWVQAKIC